MCTNVYDTVTLMAIEAMKSMDNFPFSNRFFGSHRMPPKRLMQYPIKNSMDIAPVQKNVIIS